MARRSRRELTIGVEFRSTQPLEAWAESPGIEHWWVALMVSAGLGREIVLAQSFLVRIDNNLCVDPVFELDNLSADLGAIASAIYADHDENLADIGLWVMGNSTALVAEDVVVDRAWRGHGLGPALLMIAGDVLRADALFLTPAALRTTWSAEDACWVSRYDLPRGDRADLERVRRAWRRAGFRKLRGQVVWRPVPDDHGAAARRTLDDFQEGALRSSTGMIWSRRRTRSAGSRKLPKEEAGSRVV